MIEWPVKEHGKLTLIGATDLHWSPRNLGKWIYEESYQDLMDKCLDSIIKLGKRINADALMIAGDIFHSSAAQKNPIHFVNHTMMKMEEVHKKGDMDVMVVAGNHDQKRGSNEDLLDTPLGTLMMSGNVVLLDDNPIRYYIGDSYNVTVAGRSFHHAEANWFANYTKERSSHFDILLGHFLFGPSTGVMHNENVYGPDYLGNGDFDMILMGHRHENQGCQIVDDKYYLAPGAVTRTGLYSHDLTRVPTVFVIEITAEEVKVNQVALDWLPPIDQIFNLTELEKRKRDKVELEQFIENLGVANISLNYNLDEMLKSMGVGPEVLTRCLAYLDDE